MVTLSIVEDPVLELVLQLRQEQWLSWSRNSDREPPLECSRILYLQVFQDLIPKGVSCILSNVDLNTEIVL